MIGPVVYCAYDFSRVLKTGLDISVTTITCVLARQHVVDFVNVLAISFCVVVTELD